MWDRLRALGASRTPTGRRGCPLQRAPSPWKQQETNDKHYYVVCQLFLLIAYALCFGNPICSSIWRGVKCCLDIFVGVGFLRGGNAAIVYFNKQVKLNALLILTFKRRLLTFMYVSVVCDVACRCPFNVIYIYLNKF